MAKRSGRSDGYYAYANRDNIYPSLAVRPLVSRVYLRPVPSLLSSLEDRRIFHPLSSFAPAATVSRRAQRSLIPSGTRLRFNVPDKVLICIRRKRRREVLHALNRTSSGAGRSKRRSFHSSISCKV